MRLGDQNLTNISTNAGKQRRKCADLTSLLFLWLSTLIIISQSAMAIPVNYLQFYLDEPQTSSLSRITSTLIIIDPSDNEELQQIGEIASAEEPIREKEELQEPQQTMAGSPVFTKRRINMPLQTALLADATRHNPHTSGGPQKLMRIERNFHSNHGADAKIFQINTVSDLPMFRFG
uniref:Uncharacterized protein n=1 Tax=Ditylenchus dipsaci TaxID=166011 RepID=A0A915DGF9_9BILA